MHTLVLKFDGMHLWKILESERHVHSFDLGPISSSSSTWTTVKSRIDQCRMSRDSGEQLRYEKQIRHHPESLLGLTNALFLDIVNIFIEYRC